MSNIIVVDANIILSALLGGKPSKILFNTEFNFVTAEFSMNEVRKYIPIFARKLSVPEYKLNELFSDLPIFVYDDAFYQPSIRQAAEMIEHLDRKDVSILALVIQLESRLWSQDKHFEKCGFDRILKTEDFVKYNL